MSDGFHLEHEFFLAFATTPHQPAEHSTFRFCEEMECFVLFAQALVLIRKCVDLLLHFLTSDIPLMRLGLVLPPLRPQ